MIKIHCDICRKYGECKDYLVQCNNCMRRDIKDEKISHDKYMQLKKAVSLFVGYYEKYISEQECKHYPCSCAIHSQEFENLKELIDDK